ncbi:chorismate mutase aro7 [Tilletia horrida]|nr:chorismate mutase aro7 [Tilletia horrida]
MLSSLLTTPLAWLPSLSLILISLSPIASHAASSSSAASPFLNPSSPPAAYTNLTAIRNVLEQMENYILFALLERSQYPLDPSLYTKPVPSQYVDLVGSKKRHGSVLDWYLDQDEASLARTGQWDLPAQTPFTDRKHLPKSAIASPPKYPTVLHGAGANFDVNAALLQTYINQTLPSLQLVQVARGRKSVNPALGPTLSADASLLHALSSRTLIGRYVAESKFESNTSLYTDYIRHRDLAALTTLITNKTVEDQNVARVRTKMAVFSTGGNAEQADQILVDAAGSLYKDVLIPLTKQVEIGYLLGRLW